MATSPIYSWPEPDNTDLVKNGALAIRTLGDAIDTTMGTMVAKTIVDAKADLIVGTAADTVSRLAVGTNGQVLTADSTVSPTGLKWATPSAGGGGKVLQVVSAVYNTKTDSTTSSYIDTGLTATITPSSATSKIIVAWGIDWRRDSANAANAVNMKLLRGATAIITSYSLGYTGSAINMIATWAGTYQDSPATTSATTYKIQFNSDNGTGTVSSIPYGANSLGSIVLMEIGA